MTEETLSEMTDPLLWGRQRHCDAAQGRDVLNAVHMMGYAVFWSTGLDTNVLDVQEVLGFDPLEYRFLGLAAIGTLAADSPSMQRPDFCEFVTEWTRS